MVEHSFKDENERIYRNLLDAGCSREFADDFFRLEDKQKKLQLLSCHRCSLLNQIHERQKQLDCLDYLIHSMREKSKPE